MDYIKRKFMNLKIRSKMVYSYILIALIPFCLLGILGVSLSIREAEKNVTQHSTQMVGQVQQTIDIYVNSIEKTVNMLIQTVEPMHLNDIWSSENERWKKCQEELSTSFQTVAQTHSEVAGIFFATENDLYVSTRMSRISRDPFSKENWYQKAKENPDEMLIISDVTGRNIMTDSAYSIDDVFSVVKAVKDSKTDEIVGVLLFDIKHDIISSAIQDAIIGENGFIYVMDSENHMVYTPTNEVVYRINPEWLKNAEEPLTVKIKGQKYQLRYQQSEYIGLKIVSVSPHQEIMGGVNMLMILFGILLVATLLIVLFVAVKISETVTKPIVELRNLMQQTEKGDLTIRFESEYQDEISDLGRSFNHMLVRIQELLKQVYVEQENKRQAELKVVQEQFKPHFLYNTLDTIGWMAREHSADDIVHLVNALTNVFRISLSKGKDYITLEEEMRYISNYLYIQKIRYGPKVLYETDMDPACAAEKVPKLILQPLVENAIYHGVKMKRGDGHLSVRVAMENKTMIRLEVRDDGRGMDREKALELEKLLNEPSSPDQNQSFGLFYVKERLRIRYGDSFRVEVWSRENEGTVITIFIPAGYDE